eukprot:472492-Hanusia_phi.AAC.3
MFAKGRVKNSENSPFGSEKGWVSKVTDPQSELTWVEGNEAEESCDRSMKVRKVQKSYIVKLPGQEREIEDCNQRLLASIDSLLEENIKTSGEVLPAIASIHCLLMSDVKQIEEKLRDEYKQHLQVTTDSPCSTLESEFIAEQLAAAQQLVQPMEEETLQLKAISAEVSPCLQNFHIIYEGIRVVEEELQERSSIIEQLKQEMKLVMKLVRESRGSRSFEKLEVPKSMFQRRIPDVSTSACVPPNDSQFPARF